MDWHIPGRDITISFSICCNKIWYDVHCNLSAYEDIPLLKIMRVATMCSSSAAFAKSPYPRIIHPINPRSISLDVLLEIYRLVCYLGFPTRFISREFGLMKRRKPHFPWPCSGGKLTASVVCNPPPIYDINKSLQYIFKANIQDLLWGVEALCLKDQPSQTPHLTISWYW